MGVIPESKVNGSIDRNHLDAYVHGAHEWKISLYDDGIDYWAPYNSYKYGVENKPSKTSWKRPDRPQLPISDIVKSLEVVDEGAASTTSKGEKRKRKALAS